MRRVDFVTFECFLFSLRCFLSGAKHNQGQGAEVDLGAARGHQVNHDHSDHYVHHDIHHQHQVLTDHPHHHDINFHLVIEQHHQVHHDHHNDPDHHQVHLVLGRQGQVVVDDARKVPCDITKQNSYNRRGNNEKWQV